MIPFWKRLWAVWRGLSCPHLKWKWPRTEVVLSTFQIILAIATIFSTIIAYKQADFTRQQLDEMRAAGDDTRKLIEAAKRQAEASAENANIALRSMISGQRAWVGPLDAKVDGKIEAGNPVKISVAIRNTGKEPALNLVSEMNRRVVTTEEDRNGLLTEAINHDVEWCVAKEPRDKAQVIYPSTEVGRGYDLTTEFLGSEIDEAAVKGEKILLVTGCLTYVTFSETKHSLFCYFYQFGRTQPEHLGICPTGSYAE